MHKNNMKRIKSAVVSSVIAVSAMATPLSAVVMNASAASDNYAKLLQYSLYFYDANMCGDEVGKKSALSWRDNCHTGDEVTGGFHDAGDHAMFGLPQGYTASALGWSYYEFKDAFNSTGQAEHLKLITDHFCEFFKKSTKLNGDTVSSFLYQKEDGNKDHAYWGTPENQENIQGKRKMYWTSSGASDIAADYAAALAINYINFGNAEDLKYAEALYKFSTQYNQCATDGPQGFYDSNDCRDEQANAAGWLYLATNNESYKNDCASKQVQYLGWVDGWSNRDLGAACVYSHITGDWSKVTSFLQQFSAEKTQNGYFFADKWGSARINASMQFTTLVATKNSNADFLDWSKGQMDYLTGSNPTNTCFVVGLESNSAKNPHHRAASGYKSYDEFDGSNTANHSPNGHSLVGALVGGPLDANGTYTDSMADYVANEVALDYNAGLVGAAAGLYELTKSGSTVSSIDGVTKIYNGSVSNPNHITTNPIVSNITTTASNPIGTTTTTTQGGNTSSSSGHYSVKPNKTINYDQNADDKMVGFEWSQFNIPANEKVTKVEVKISSKNGGNVGKWQGAFGTSTSVAPDYWAQGDDMQQEISGNSGTVTWNVPSNIADIAQFQYGGEVKFGTWWVDCQDFVIDEINVYTNAYSGSAGTTATTQSNQSGNNTTTTTAQGNNNTSAGTYEIKPNKTVNYDKNSDDKMVGFEWSQFNIPATEKVKKVEITIASKNGGNVGKWQGAFGTSTSVAPEYWAQGDDMEQNISGNRGTVTWNVPANIADIAQYQYGGEVKFGTWWVDCQDFVIESIKVYTDGTSSQQTTTSTTRPTTTTTTTNNNVSGSIKYGDADTNGTVNISDAVLIMQSISNPGEYKLSEQGKKNADVVDGDGVTNVDALAIQMLEAKLINLSDFPTTSNKLK